jgi:hypothetical protein
VEVLKELELTSDDVAKDLGGYIDRFDFEATRIAALQFAQIRDALRCVAMTLASRLSHSSAIARPSPREARKIRTVDFVVMPYSDQRAHAGDALGARLRCSFALLAGLIRSLTVGDDVTAFALNVAPKCPYTSDWESAIAMPMTLAFFPV